MDIEFYGQRHDAFADPGYKAPSSVGGLWGSWLSGGQESTPAVPVEVPKGNCANGFTVGGATTQSRFAGRTAVPIATKTPQSVQEIGNTAPALPLDPTPVAPAPLISNPTGDSAATDVAATAKGPWKSAWTFNFSEWKWEVDSEGGLAAYNHNKALAAEREQLAARRWGGGRDNLLNRNGEQDQQAAIASSLFPNANPNKPNFNGPASWGPNSLDDLGGLFEAKKALRESVLLHLKHPQLLSKLGLRAGVMGVLLHGPPGTGKTLLARAIAREAGPGVHTEFISCAEVAAVEGGASRLRGAFQNCRRIGPAILVLDEVDCLCPSRDAQGATAAANDPVYQSAATLLELLDGGRSVPGAGANSSEKRSPPLVVIGTTSRRHALDPAVTRAGRLDREVALGLPSLEERAEILDRLLRAAREAGALSPEVDLAALAERTRGFVPADLYALCAAASLLAIKRALWSLELSQEGRPLDGASIDVARLRALVVHPAVLDRFSTEEVLQSTRLDVPLLECALSDIQPSNMRSYEFSVEMPKVSFEEIGGLEEIKRELREAVLLPLQRPELFRRFGARPPRGVLLYGPPGTGKTMLAKAVATSCGAHFLPVQGPQLLSMWLGESERNVRNVFATARRSKPCVVFFDELDSIALRRDHNSDPCAARVLNQLLVEMDGLSSGTDDELANGGVFVLAATNRPELIDPALLRPGRFDALIHVSLPDAAARRHILEGYLGGGRADPSVDLAALAAHVEGFSSADVAELAQKAVRLCIRQAVQEGRALCVGREHVEEALLSTRRSVTLSEVRRFEGIEAALRSGQGLPLGKGPGGNQGAATAMAMVKLLSSELSSAKTRIQELEAALEEAKLRTATCTARSTSALSARMDPELETHMDPEMEL